MYTYLFSKGDSMISFDPGINLHIRMPNSKRLPINLKSTATVGDLATELLRKDSQFKESYFLSHRTYKIHTFSDLCDIPKEEGLWKKNPLLKPYKSENVYKVSFYRDIAIDMSKTSQKIQELIPDKKGTILLLYRTVGNVKIEQNLDNDD